MNNDENKKQENSGIEGIINDFKKVEDDILKAKEVVKEVSSGNLQSLLSKAKDSLLSGSFLKNIFGGTNESSQSDSSLNQKNQNIVKDNKQTNGQDTENKGDHSA